MPAIHHIRPADYRTMRWKNGLGTTTEIAVHPYDAGLDAFAWRVSMADLAASGPFSRFPGYERVIIQTEGAPVTLAHEGGGRHRLALLTPYRFEGEWATAAELELPPARDINVIAQRDLYTPSAAVHCLARGSTTRLCSTATTQIVHAFRGELAVEVDPGDERLEFAAADTLIVTGEAGLAITATPGDAVAFVIELASPPWSAVPS